MVPLGEELEGDRLRVILASSLTGASVDKFGKRVYRGLTHFPVVLCAPSAYTDLVEMSKFRSALLTSHGLVLIISVSVRGLFTGTAIVDGYELALACGFSTTLLCALETI